MDENSLMLEMGAILLVAFIGAALASKGKQSVILGYIVAGIVIGPFIHISIAGFDYNGLIQDRSMINSLSQVGLILLIFFVGLEFSFDKIKRVKGPAIILSLVDVGVNLFTGFVLATALGWPLVDSIFLAAVLSMSCSAVAMKTLMELGRLGNPETEYMLGMIIMEEFISMIFLTVVGGLIVHTDANFSLTGMITGMVIFFVFFALMAAFVIPRTVTRLQKMESDELFIIFMLGIIMLSAAFAELCGVPPLIGAFFIGMTFAETKVMERMERKITPIRDAFVAIFFVSFGMLIDPSMFGAVIGVVIAALVLIIIDEILIMSAIAYLVGFPRRAAVSIGASFSARGGESVMYASVGSQAAGATKGAELNPIAGAVTFIMSALCPFFIKKSYALADWTARSAPHFIRYGSALISRTLGKLIIPASFKLYKVPKRYIVSLAAYLISMIAIIATTGDEHMIAYACAVAVTAATWYVVQSELERSVRLLDYSNLGTKPGHHMFISRYIASFACLGLLMCVTVAFLYAIYWPSVFIVILAYFLWLIFLMKTAHDVTCDMSLFVRSKKKDGPAPVRDAPHQHGEKPQFNYRQRWKDF